MSKLATVRGHVEPSARISFYNSCIDLKVPDVRPQWTIDNVYTGSRVWKPGLEVWSRSRGWKYWNTGLTIWTDVMNVVYV